MVIKIFVSIILFLTVMNMVTVFEYDIKLYISSTKNKVSYITEMLKYIIRGEYNKYTWIYVTMNKNSRTNRYTYSLSNGKKVKLDDQTIKLNYLDKQSFLAETKWYDFILKPKWLCIKTASAKNLEVYELSQKETYIPMTDDGTTIIRLFLPKDYIVKE